MTHILYQTLLSLLASLFFGILFQVRGRNLCFAALSGGLCWLVYALVCEVIPSSQIPAYFLSAAATALFAELCARAFHSPAGVFTVVGVIPLVPGGGIYRTMLLCISGTAEQALSACISTIGIAGAMAMGVMVTSSIVRMVTHRRRSKT